MRIGLFGGTFNPIHNGHLQIAQTCLEKIKLNKIVFIPSGNPPHKNKKNIVDAKHRYKMTVLAIQNNPYFEIDPIEMFGTKYSYQTISYFKNIRPNHELYFIIGADSFLNIHKWKKYEFLLTMCNFIIINRPDFDIKKSKLKLKKNHHLLNNLNIDISSTNIRKSSQNIKYNVHTNVEKYIKQNNLYKLKGYTKS